MSKSPILPQADQTDETIGFQPPVAPSGPVESDSTPFQETIAPPPSGLVESDSKAYEETIAPRPVDSAEGTLEPSGSRTLNTTVPRPAIEGYQFYEELGRGAMGVVYKAAQTRLHRLVAVKMILSGEYASVDARLRFLSEAEVVAKLVHPNIVQLYEFNVYEGKPYFALEFVDGGTLADKLQGEPLPFDEAAAFTETLARAMQTAHDLGIIHRDLKPGNILLQTRPEHDSKQSHPRSGSHRPPSGLHSDSAFGAMSCTLRGKVFIPKVTDFGLAKSEDLDSRLTATGVVMGTPSYMAPEQASGKAKSVGPAADIYAIGSILYECLTGRPPFRAATAMDTMMQVIEEEPLPPSRLQPKIPRDLETICLKCLQKDPALRYSSTHALAEDLAAYLNNEPITARPVSKFEHLRRWAIRKPAIAALSSGLVILVMLGLLSGWWMTAQLSQALAQAQQAQREAEQQTLLAQQQEREAHHQRQLADEQTLRARQQQQLAQEQQKRAEANAQEVLRQKALVLKNFQEQVRTVGEISTNIDKRLEEEGGNDGVRLDILDLVIKSYRGLLADSPEDPLLKQRLATAYFNQARIQGSISARTADASYAQAIELLRELTQSHPKNDEFASQLAGTWYFRAFNAYRVKNLPRADEYFTQAREHYAKLVERLPKLGQRAGLADWYAGQVCEESKKPQEAVKLYQASIDRLSQLAQANPDNADLLEDLGLVHSSLAYCVETTDLEKAYEHFQQAHELHRKTVKLRPQMKRYRTNAHDAFMDLYTFCQARHRDDQLAALAAEYAEDQSSYHRNYNAACFYSLAHSVVLQHPKLSPDERAQRSKKYLQLAISHLNKSLDDGYLERDHIANDRDLDSIRDSEGYKAYMAKIDERLQGRKQDPSKVFDVLIEDFMQKFQASRSSYPTNIAARKRALRQKPDFSWYAQRILTIARERGPLQQASIDGATWVVKWAQFLSKSDPSAEQWLNKALDQLAPAAARPEFVNCCKSLADYPCPGGDQLLVQASSKNSDPAVRGVARYCHAQSLLKQASAKEDGSAEQQALQDQAEAILAKVEAEYDSVQYNSTTLGTLARKDLVKLRTLSIGKLAREITGTTLDDKPIKLSQFRGKWTVVVFWANWCGPCRRLLPKLRDYLAEDQSGRLAILGVNSDDVKKQATDVAALEKLNFPTVYDGQARENKIFDEWNVNAMPSAFLIDPDGVIRWKADDGLDPTELFSKLDTLLKKAQPKRK